MAKPILCSRPWLGATLIALGMTTTIVSCFSHAQAQVIIDHKSAGNDLNFAGQPQTRKLQFFRVADTKPLLPPKASDLTQRIFLIPPTTKNSTLIPTEPPVGGYKLRIPKEQKIVLTPPPGVKVYLPKPKPKKVTQKAKVTKPRVQNTRGVEAKPIAPVVDSAFDETIAPVTVATAKIKNGSEKAASQDIQKTADKAVENAKADIAKAAPKVEIKPVTNSAKTEAEKILGQKPDLKTTASQDIQKTANKAVENAKADIAQAVPKDEIKSAAQSVKSAGEALPDAKKSPEPPKPIAKMPTIPVMAPAPPPVPAKLIEVPPLKENSQIAALSTTQQAQKTSKSIASSDANTVKTKTSLQFDAGDAHLNDNHRTQLNTIISNLNSNPESTVELMAFAHAGDHSKSRRLSLSRALAVRSYLLQKEIRNTRIQVRAMGDQVQSGKSDRVDIIIK